MQFKSYLPGKWMKTTEPLAEIKTTNHPQPKSGPENVMVTAVGNCLCKLSTLAREGHLFGPDTPPFQMEGEEQPSCRTPASFSQGNISKFFRDKEREILKRHEPKNCRYKQTKKTRIVKGQVSK